MRKIFLLILPLLVLQFTAFAEDPGKGKGKEVPVGIINEDGSVNWVPGELDKKGTHIAVSGYKLPVVERRSLLSNIAGEDLNPKWDKYNAEFWSGVGLTFNF